MGDEDLREFLKWAAKIGISDAHSGDSSSSSCLGCSLFVSHFPEAGGRGLAAARELRKGEMVLRVPKNALMHSGSVLEADKFLAASVGRYPNLSPAQVLIICLLSETCKGRSSRWYPYLIHLPRTYSLLVNFSEFELQALQVDDAICTSKQALSKVQNDWREATSLMQDIHLRPQFLTFQSWIWAFATISSRTMYIPWDEAGCLCPVGDFFNYATPGINAATEGNEQVDDEFQRLTDAEFDDMYYFYARKRYRKGEQVLLCYGTYTNLELLEHYGFLLSDNPNDKVIIQYETGTQNWPKESLYIQSDGKPSFSLLCSMRLSNTPSNQRKAVAHLAHSGSVLSVENEISVMRVLSRICTDILRELPSSVEEDKLLLTVLISLGNGSLSHETLDMLTRESATFKREIDEFLQKYDLRKGAIELPLPTRAERSLGRLKLAIQWRIQYKETLCSCIKYCTQTIDLLALDSKVCDSQRSSPI